MSTLPDAIREAVECADADALCWFPANPTFPSHWGINGPSPWRDLGVAIDPGGALEMGLIGLRHYTRRTRVYVTRAGRKVIPVDTADR